MEDIYYEEQMQLPEHLRGRYRFGVQYDEIKDCGPKLRRLFSFKFATEKEVFDRERERERETSIHLTN